MAATTQERTLDLERPIRDDRHRTRRPDAPPACRFDGAGRAADDRDAGQGPGAARRAVPLRRRAPGVRDARRHHPPPARVARARPRSSGHARRALEHHAAGRSPRARVAAIAGAGVKQMAQRFIVGEDARDALPRSRSCGATASRRPSICSARRRSPRPRPTATPRAARTRCARWPPPRPSPTRSTSPSRSPRSPRCCAPKRPSAGSRARARACATCCASPATSAPTCTSTWSPSTRARRSPSSRSTC